MGAKSKTEEFGLVELIIDKWEGGKNTIVYVTEEVNKKIKELGLKVTISREGIRRVIKNHKEEIEDFKHNLETVKALAEVLKDNPGTEIIESAAVQFATLIQKEVRCIQSVEFENPKELANAITKLADSQVKLSNYRTKAIKVLEKAKEEIKKELQNAIKSDTELLQRLYVIIDKVEVK